MDSPLLPTYRNRPSTHPSQSASRDLVEDPSLLADLSIEDDDYGADDSFLPSSPIRSSSSLRPLGDRGSGSASSSRSGSRSVSIAENEDGDDTPKRTIVGGGKGNSKPRFSLFAPPRPPSTEIPGSDSPEHSDRREREVREDEDGEGDGEEDEEGEDGDDQTIHAQAGPSRQQDRVSSGDRDDRLRESLYELRRMNEVFEGFLGALEASRGHNERLAIRVKQTSALLDEYTALLGQSEHTQKLLSNPNWTGAHDDAAAIEAEQLAAIQAEEARQREAEEAAEAARLAEEEKERRRVEAERAKEAGRGSSVGRGRGGTRGGVIRGKGSGIPTSSTSKIGTKTSTPTTGIRRPTTTTGTSGGGSASGAGTGSGTGKYGHVASSGYGPPSRK